MNKAKDIFILLLLFSFLGFCVIMLLKELGVL